MQLNMKTILLVLAIISFGYLLFQIIRLFFTSSIKFTPPKTYDDLGAGFSNINKKPSAGGGGLTEI
jgi:hypothetical protein